jgi:hypothetical protein
MVVAGIMAVRLPHLNSLRGVQPHAPQIDGLSYAGLDRLQWIDVFDEDFYSGNAPAEVRKLAIALKNTNEDLISVTLCRDAAVASLLLKYSNRRQHFNELIVVRSPELEAIKGAIDIDASVEWLGYDVMALGDFSLIAGGIFVDPQCYARWALKINCFGLFADSGCVEDYIAAYDEAVAKGVSEPLAPAEAGFPRIAIEVGRLNINETPRES